jgi:hypothetical protein
MFKKKKKKKKGKNKKGKNEKEAMNIYTFFKFLLSRCVFCRRKEQSPKRVICTPTILLFLLEKRLNTKM